MAAEFYDHCPSEESHCSLRTIVGIVSQLTTLETPIGMNRGFS
jgi:hypothetical protein